MGDGWRWLEVLFFVWGETSSKKRGHFLSRHSMSGMFTQIWLISYGKCRQIDRAQILWEWNMRFLRHGDGGMRSSHGLAIEQMLCFNMASQKKKNHTNNMDSYSWESNGYPSVTPSILEVFPGLLKGLLTNHDPLIRRLIQLGGKVAFPSTKMPGQRPQLPILDC